MNLKNLTLTIFIIFTVISTKAKGDSLYGSDWLIQGQPYYKTKIWQTGFHRIDYTKLTASGIPLSIFLPQNIQLFFRGNQQNIYVSDQNNNNTFDNGDYIEFWGQRNEGFLDKDLYTPVQSQVNPYYNLFSDTCSYFLTASPTGPYKRITNSPAIPAGTSQLYTTTQHLNVFSHEYSNGYGSNDGQRNYAADSRFSYGDGWYDQTRQQHTYTIDLQKTYTNYPQGRVELRINNHNSRPLKLEITASNENGISEILGTTGDIGPYENVVFIDSIENNLILSAGTVKITIKTLTNAAFNTAYLKFSYNQLLNTTAAERVFYTKNISVSDQSYEFSLFPENPAVYDITDSTNIAIVPSGIINKNLTFNLAQAVAERKIFLRNADKYFTPSDFTSARVLPQYKTVQPYSSSDSIYIILSHEALMQRTADYENPVRAYSNYRASAAGGKFDTLLVTFDELCNNYNYGERSPLAVRKFLQYMAQDMIHIPDYLFIIGKGVSIACSPDGYEDYYRKVSPEKQTIPNFIPPMGNPGSDILYSAGLGNLNPNIPLISTGRVAAITPNDVAAYLDKIIVSENQPQDELWHKQLLHLSGGKDVGQIKTFRSYVNAWGKIAEGDYWGAKATTYSKTSINATQIFDVSQEVNNGVKLLTFFGHSGQDATDITIGYVDDPVYNYHNQDKYPMIILNGCLAGNIFDVNTFGESWIKSPNRGAISVLGLTDDGYDLTLQNYTTTWYLKQFADSTYSNKSLGEIHKEVSRQFLSNNTDLQSVAQTQQMLLQGDPAHILFKPQLPDYQISDAQLFIKRLDKNKDPITAITDSFEIDMLVKNLGKTDLHKLLIPVRVTRTLPDGTIIKYATKTYLPVNFTDTLRFVIYTTGVNSFGNNSFYVELDFDNKIRELLDNNNTARISIFLQQSGVNCLYPREFSIVNGTKTNFIAQSTDLLTSAKDYIFEIDTAWNFSSPYKQTQAVTAVSLPSINDYPLIAGLDSVVYYWRVHYKDLASSVDTIFGTSSFIHIPNGNPGWAQAQFPQFLKNTNSYGLSTDISAKTWNFDKRSIDIKVRTQVDDYGKTYLSINKIPHIYNGNQRFYWETTPSGVLALAFKKSTIESYTIFGEKLHPNGSVNLYLRGSNTNGFLTDNFLEDTVQQSRYGFTKAYLDSIKTGDYVLFFTSADAQIASWGRGLKNRLIQQGATKVNYIKNGYPYIFLYKKDAGVLAEITADTTDDQLAFSTPIGLDTSIIVQYNKGTITSTKIGPASSWKNLYRKVITDHQTDSWKFNICGYTLGNRKDTLWTGIPVDGMDISTLADASIYTYIGLEAMITDTSGSIPTPPNLDHWIVTYDNNIPEGILSVNTNDTPVILNKNYQEGEQLKVVYNFKNITNTAFKSPLIVQYVTKSINNGTTFIKYDTIKTVLAAQSSITQTHYFDTQGYVGDVNFQIFINPHLQPEEYYTNNVLVISGKVIRNTFNPLLEVTFDGAKIMDGDIVSPSPLIHITISDFNKFLRKTDTTGIKILIKKDGCASCSFEQIPMNSPEIRFIPESTNNKYHVEYKPKNLSDGRYIIAVQASDAVGLESGINPYQVRFEVINKSTITNFYPYPNPFTDHTRFVFTLTGSEIPDELKITIMTVSGIVVKEILQNEIGPIRIGNNMTQYAWDGKDQFGDKLANGVYLYKVQINSQGSQIEHRASGGDQAFKNNIGKIVILK